jgi:hypothetical protein
VCLIVPYYYGRNSTSKFLYIMKIKDPFVKLVMFDWAFAQVKDPLLNAKLKIERSNGSFRFFNIHISYKAQLAMFNMSMKWHHISIYFFKCKFEHDLTWFLAHCFVILPSLHSSLIYKLRALGVLYDFQYFNLLKNPKLKMLLYLVFNLKLEC